MKEHFAIQKEKEKLVLKRIFPLPSKPSFHHLWNQTRNDGVFPERYRLAWAFSFFVGFFENERDVKRLRGFLLYSFSVY
jgi:hypothetical protein